MKTKEVDYLLKKEISIESKNLTPEQFIGLCRRAIKEHSFFKIKDGKDKGIIDVQTANALLTVYDNLSEEAQAKFKRLYISKGVGWLGHKCWELIEKCCE